MEYYELVELYLKESAEMLYQCGLVHGLATDMINHYSLNNGQGDCLSVEVYDLEQYKCGGSRIESKIEQAIRGRLTRALDIRNAWSYGGLTQDHLERLINRETIRVDYICDGGIYDSIFNGVSNDYRRRRSTLKRNERDKYDKEFKSAIDKFFDEIDFHCYGSGKVLFRDAPRYSVKMTGGSSGFFMGFEWIVIKMEAVVSENICLLFVFGNSE